MKKINQLLVAAGFILLRVFGLAFGSSAGVAVTTQHGLTLNASSVITGSVRLLNGETVTVNGPSMIKGDLLVPGTPTLSKNGTSTCSGIIVGAGSAQPSNYQIILNSNASIGYLDTRTDPVAMPVVNAPPAPKGTRNVTISSSGQSIGDFSTLCNLILNGSVGQVAVPPGTYGAFTINGGSGSFVFGIQGSTFTAVYNLQGLVVSGSAPLVIVGPSIINLPSGVTLSGVVGNASEPQWLAIETSAGNIILNSGCQVYASVYSPSGNVVLNGISSITGAVFCGTLMLDGSACAISYGSGDNTPPVVTIVQPAQGSVSNNTKPQITVQYQDLPGPGETQASGVDLSTLVVKLDNNDISSLFTKTSSQATAQVSSALAQGSHTINASIKDLAGNQGASSSTFTVDLATPSIQITSPAQGSYIATTMPAINVQYSDSAGVSTGTLKILINGVDKTSLFTKTLTGATVALTAANALPQGANQITASISDIAGNTGSASSSFTVDTVPPVITASVSPKPNSAGWNNSNVTVTFTGTDSISGIKSITTPQVVSTEGANQLIVGTAVDFAGNISTTAVKVNLDKTPPVLTSSKNPQPNSNSWNNSSVTVSFTASDSLSGVFTVTPPQIVSSNGANQLITGTAVDLAGNVSTATVSVSIDTTTPVITASVSPQPNSSNWNNSNITVAFTASDSISGIQSVTPPQSITTQGANQLVTGVAQNYAGTVSSKTVAVNIDKTPPSITAVQSPAPNGNGWNNSNVTVNFTATDSLSGVAKVTSPQVVSTNGANQVITGTAIDLAGNISTATITVNLDESNPVISAVQSPQPNAAGWNNTNVTVNFTASDSISGIQGVTPSQTITTQGANQLVTGTAQSYAGNISTITLPVSIDKTGPVITGTISPKPDAAGWNNSSVIVNFTATDSLSGVAQVTPQQVVSTNGANQIVSGTAVDAAGNISTTTVTVNLDESNPVISAALNPKPNANGWNNTNVTVSFTATDAVSGIQSVTPPQTITTQGAGQLVTGSAESYSGDVSSQTAAVNVDKTAPTIAAVLTPPPNSAGWNNSNVTVSFKCSDNLSGVAAVPANQLITAEGAGQSVTGAVSDLAGNVSTTTATLNIDKTPPVITASKTPPANSFGWNNSNVTVNFTATDSLSGVAQVTPPQVISTNGANQMVSGTAADAAGNVSTTTVTVNLDESSPVISAAVSPRPNANGWNNTNVTVSFAASDSISAIQSVTPSQAITTEGASQLVSGSAASYAGNVSTTAISVNLDKTPPVISNISPANGSTVASTAPVISASLSDNLSGINTASVQMTLDGKTVTAIVTANSVTFTPAQSLSYSSHTVTIIASDNAGNQAQTMTASFTVQPARVTLPPIAVSDTYAVIKNNALTVSAPGVLGNDSDPNNLVLTAVLAQNVSHGALAFNSDGSFTYTPGAGFIGIDTFTYRAFDGLSYSSATVVTINVNDTPSYNRSLPLSKGDVPAIVKDAAGDLYALSDGIWKSTDSAGSWVSVLGDIPTRDVYTIAAHPSQKGVLYAGTTDRGLYKTQDGGLTWVKVGFNVPTASIWKVIFDPQTPETLYIGTSTGVYKSVDSGYNWIECNNGLGNSDPVVGSLAIDPSNPAHLFAGKYYGMTMYVSTDAAKSWQILPPSAYGPHVEGITIDPQEPNNIYVYGWQTFLMSSDGGNTWATLRPSNGCPEFAPNGVYAITSISVDPLNDRILYASTGEGLFVSRDQANSWSKVLYKPIAYTAHNVLIDPDNNQVLYLISSQGIDKSLDGSLTWHESDAGIANAEITDIKTSPANPNMMYALATYQGLYESADKGQDWQNISLGSTNTARVALHPTDPRVMLESYYLRKSSDTGRDWFPSQQSYAYIGYTICFHPMDPSTAYSQAVELATQAGSLYISKDAGLSWQPIVNDTAGYGDIAFHPTDPNQMWAGYAVWTGGSTNYIGVAHSTDKGNSWTKVQFGYGSNPTTVLIDKTNPQTLYAQVSDGVWNGVDYSGVWKSMDGGLSWSQQTEGMANTEVYDIAQDSSGALYAGTPEGLYKSVDGAGSWSLISSVLDLPYQFVSKIAVSQDAQTIYLGTNGGVYDYTPNLGALQKNTLVGQNVNVAPRYAVTGDLAGINVAFDNVTSQGNTLVTTSSGVVVTASSGTADGLAVMPFRTAYTIKTDAGVSGGANLSFYYGYTDFPQNEQYIKVMKLTPSTSGGAAVWTDITTSVDTNNRIVYCRTGQVSASGDTYAVCIDRKYSNHAPIAVDDSYSTWENLTLNVSSGTGVLANDYDYDFDTLTAVLGQAPANGSVTLNADGSFVYTPNQGFSGTDSFTYMAFDGLALSNEAVVTINVQAIYPSDVMILGSDQNQANPKFIRVNEDGVVMYERDLSYQGFYCTPASMDRNLTEDSLYFLPAAWHPENQVNNNDLVTKLKGNGDTEWQVQVASGVYSISANPVFGGCYVANYASGIYRLNSDGSIAWGPKSYAAPQASTSWQVHSDAVTGGAYLYDNASQTIYKIDKDGSLLWQKPFAGLALLTPCPKDGGVYAAIYDSVIKFAADGSIIWKAPTIYSGPASQSVNPNTGALYMTGGVWTPHWTYSSFDFSLQKYDIEGNSDWNIPVGQNALAAANSDGNVYLGMNGGQLGVSMYNDASQLLWNINPGYYPINYQVCSYVPGAGVPATTINSAVTITNDTYLAVANTPLTVPAPGVLANDVYTPGANIVPVVVSASVNGSVKLNTDGSFTYTPALGFAGTDSFEYKISSGTTLSSQTGVVIISVVQPNLPPVVNAGASQAITFGNTANLSGSYTDDGLPVNAVYSYQWSVIGEPANGYVIFSSTKSLNTTASFSAVGSYVLQLSVSDSQLTGSATTQITVTKANTPPQVTASITQNPVQLPSGAMVGCNIVSGGLPVTSIQWSVIGNSSNGTVTFASPNAQQSNVTFSQQGVYKLQVSVYDGQFTTVATLSVKVLSAPTGIYPVVTISSPTACARVTCLTTISGTAYSANLQYYTLQYKRSKASTWNTFVSSTTNVSGGVLGVFDPCTLKNGVYTILLTATDWAGQYTTASVTIVVSGYAKLGQLNFGKKDMTLSAPGMNINVVRQYDSRAAAAGEQGDFGPGWSLANNTPQAEDAQVEGQGWDQYTTQDNYGITYYNLLELSPHQLVVTYSDTDQDVFTLDVNPKKATLYPLDEMTVGYKASSTTFSTAVALDESQTVYMDSDNQQLITSDGETFNPQRFKITRRDGSIYVINEQTGLESVTDTHGHTITYDSYGIHHSSGISVNFTRNANAGNRIEQITDSNGRTLEYKYDASGNLSQVLEIGGASQPESILEQYAYENGLGQPQMKTITAPDGTNLGGFDYDSTGKLIDMIDANGNKVLYGYDTIAQSQTITDRLGNQTVYSYDANGNVTQKKDALGTITNWEYDAYNHETKQSVIPSPLAGEGQGEGGIVTQYNYSPQGDLLSTTDALNHTTTNIYDSNGHLLNTTDALGNSTTNYYDPSGNLTQTTDALGNNTFYQYDSDGNQTQVKDALNNVTQNTYDGLGHLVVASRFIGGVPVVTNYTYDSYGNQLTQTQTRTLSNGGTETILSSSTYDAQNRLIASADALGNISTIQYNAIGKQSTTTDKLNHLTASYYDPNGNLSAIVHPDGSCETYTYDAENHKLTSCDVAGSTTTYTYDALGRLLRTTNPDNTYTENVYDALGRVVSSVSFPSFVIGNPVVTTYAYDAVGNRTLSVDALGNQTTYYYDANNNNTGITDANGNTTQYIYDNLNRRQMTIYADGSSESVVYDALGRTTSKSDQANNVTNYVYDALGHLVQVLSFPNGIVGNPLITQYTYDELGNQLTQTDANNHTTKYVYDELGRRTSRTLPLGQTETCTYDANGNMLTKTDFNGKLTTYAYDNMNRPLSIIPDRTLNEPTISYTYDTAGRRQTMTDASGQTTYSYDNRSRITTKASPQGTLTYAYDGYNMSGIYTSHGSSTTYSYDALNRLSAVCDGINVTTYTYDADGNLAGYTYPNGIATQYIYNNLNRLTNVSSLRAGGAAISSFGYTLDPTGNRLSVNELTGRTVNYVYDNLYRLTKETISGGTVNGSIGYTYDNVGNRFYRTSLVSGIPNQSLSYDNNDRLNSDNYDNNGNTINSNGNTYAYTFDNRLKSVNNGSVTYSYDGDGNRISKTVAGITTNYLVDNQNPTGYTQVLEELQNGNVTKAYTYGLSLISAVTLNPAPSTLHYYLYDGHGNVTALTDSSGNITDTYQYDAFGILLSKTGTTDNNYQYCGEQYDPNTGFYYIRARYMDPAAGRFVTQDSYEGNINAPSSLHKYLYCSDNPLNLTDPSGNFTLIDGMATVAILGILTTDISSSSNLLSPKGEVQIRFNTINQAPGAYHAYILVTEANGNKTFYRGGPSNEDPWILSLRLGLLAANSISRSNFNGLYNPFGTIETKYGNYDESAQDYRTNTPCSVEVNTNGQSLFLLKLKFATNLNIINSEMIPYDPLTKNSNATAYDTLRKAGLNPGSPPVWAPGWDVSLP